MKLTPCLWFDGRALEAANYYISTFPNSEIKHIEYYDENNPHGKTWDAMMIVFSLDGNIFRILNGGPMFQISPAISFVIPCDTEEEVNHYYAKLSHIPEAEQCGWICDQFWVSWQIVPNRFIELMNSHDEVKKWNLMKEMLSMKRLTVEGIEKAYNS
jgi:predicted 3-demethylubiquinone-9 3-methyltransferase (glyoxalase superfamily)